MSKVAFVTGANGISGRAIVKYLVEHTTPEQWSRIIVTSRSPFTGFVTDPRITFIALDYSEDVDKLVSDMSGTCETITHAYFCSYVHRDDSSELYTANCSLFENFLESLQHVAPGLQNVCLQTGGKYYNGHLHPIPIPAREEDPRAMEPNDNFYYPQEDYLISEQRGKEWSWNVIRPVAIIGVTDKPNGMNEALTIAVYFLVCKELGLEAPMPTNQKYWEGVDDASYAPLIADLTIFATTNPKCANNAFNVTNGDYFSWRYMWPRLASNFGLEVTADQTFSQPPPKEGELRQDISFCDWSKDKRKAWEALCERSGAETAKATFDFATWQFMDWVVGRTWPETISISKARKFGWTGYIDTYESFVETFEEFRARGLIPPADNA